MNNDSGAIAGLTRNFGIKKLLMNKKRYYYIASVLLGLFISAGLQAQTAEKINNFKDNDKWGIGMAVIAIGVVFLGLIGLYILFNLIGSWGLSLLHKRAMRTYGVSKEEAKGIASQSGEVYAAIAMAIYEATELHDEENTILTIKNTVRNYSPWSSKIYTLRETPIRL